MEYVISCRFSEEYSSAMPIRALVPILRDAVLFSYAFSAGDMYSTPEVRTLVNSAFSETTQEFGDSLRVELESISVERSSIEIVLFVSNVEVWFQGHEQALGGIAIWASQTLGSTLISEFGKLLVRKVFHRVPSHPTSKSEEIRSHEDIAREKARQVAVENGCRALPQAGGLAVRDGKRITGYQYVYQLVGKKPGYVAVTVDRYARQPIRYEVTQIAPPHP